jgi:heme o synthase
MTSKGFKDIYELAKPGLVYGNLITTAAGFLLGARVAGPPVDLSLLLSTLAGIAFVMASGCVFNNYIDRDIDGKMARTKGRPLVTGRISGRGVIAYGVALGAIGFFLLIFFTNVLAVCAALTGFFFYVVMYSIWWKRRSAWGTFVGAIAGATPPVVGYTAAAGRFDLAALLLFLILVVWQMPHFYAIAIRRFGDYMAAGVPVLPVKRGIPATKRHMLVYVALFIPLAATLTFFGYTGFVYLAIELALGFAWLLLAIRGFRNAGPGADVRWARAMFFFSLAVMVVLFSAIGISSLWR